MWPNDNRIVAESFISNMIYLRQFELRLIKIFLAKATDSFLVGNPRSIESSTTQNISKPIIIFIIGQLKYP